MQAQTTELPELLLKLHKLYQKHHESVEAQQTRLKEDPVAEQINVAFDKYITPAVKKAAAKGFASTTINSHQINLDFVRVNFQRFEAVCQAHGIKIKLEVDPKWESDVRALKLSGWADPIPEPQKPIGLTLTDRVTALEEGLAILDRELQKLRATK